MTKRTIYNFWETRLRDEGRSKSTLQYLDLKAVSFRQPHPIWNATDSDLTDVTKARVKVKLLTGTYMLQTNKARFNKSEVDPTCRLCRLAPEDTEHFLLSCSALEDVRHGYRHLVHALLDKIPGPPRNLTPYVLLDTEATLSQSPHSLALHNITSALEMVTRRLCFALHLRRLELLNTLTSFNNKSSSTDVAPVIRGGMYL